MEKSPGTRLREDLQEKSIIPFLGVYDVFSASIVAKYFDGIFISGLSFSASYYGLPDNGFIAWSDLIGLVQRVRSILPEPHVLVDIDDGYADTEVACHVVSVLESLGASGVILEDQQRPKKCGHLDGKQIMELDAFLEKLTRVLATRRDMVVVARTDATVDRERLRRALAFSEAGADAVLVDGVSDLDFVRKLKKLVAQPVAFNQIVGGKSPCCSMEELKMAGVSIPIYSTPCLFASQAAINNAVKSLKESDGLLPNVSEEYTVDLHSCTAFLNENIRIKNAG